MTQLTITSEDSTILAISAQDLVGRRVAVLGASGYGKTNSVATLIEELAPHMPISMIDPEGEMWSLRERMDLVIVGRSENVDIEIEAHQAAAIATWSVEQGISVVLDLFGYDDMDELQAVAENYARALFEACKRAKRPHFLVVEEAHMFVPQPLSANSIWKQIARRGRKMGLGVILASQRSQNVDKDMLTQAQFCVLHYVSHPTDMGVYYDLIPAQRKNVREMVGNLRVGDAVIVDEGQITQAKIRLRHTHHPGSTPQLDPNAAIEAGPALRAADGEALAVLKQLIENAGPPKPDPKIVALKKEIRELREDKEISDSLIADLRSQLDAYKKHNERLQERVETLRLIKVEVQMVQAQAGQQVAVAAGAEPQPPETPKRTPPNHTTRQRRLIDYEPDDPPAIFAQRQRKELRRIAQWCEAQPKHDQLVLRYLLTTGERASLDTIASAMAYSEQTLKSKPPIALMDKGLIERSGKRGHHEYVFSAHRKFPHIEVDEVKAVLLKHLAKS